MERKLFLKYATVSQRATAVLDLLPLPLLPLLLPPLFLVHATVASQAPPAPSSPPTFAVVIVASLGKVQFP